MCIYIHIHTHIHTQTHIHTHTHTHRHTHTRTHTHVCIIQINVCMQAKLVETIKQTRVALFIRVFSCVRACVWHVYSFMSRIYIDIRRGKHTQIQVKLVKITKYSCNNLCVCVYMCLCACVLTVHFDMPCLCIYIYVYTYTHTGKVCRFNKTVFRHALLVHLYICIQIHTHR